MFRCVHTVKEFSCERTGMRCLNLSLCYLASLGKAAVLSDDGETFLSHNGLLEGCFLCYILKTIMQVKPVPSNTLSE